MRCKIEGCTHTRSRRGAMTNTNSWGVWMICPCCAKELAFMGDIDYNTMVHTLRCSNAIKEEQGFVVI